MHDQDDMPLLNGASDQAINRLGQKSQARRGQQPTGDGRQVVQRLMRHFGDGGDNPLLRLKLYERLEREVAQHGEDVLRIISECVQAASTARKPAHYFARAVTARLREAGYLREGSKVDW